MTSDILDPNWSALAAKLPAAALIRDHDRLAPFCAESVYDQRHNALAVVQPQSTRQIQHIVHWALEHNIALVPQGGNTNRTIAAIPQAGRPSLLINMTKHTRQIKVSAAGDSITVDAGVTLAQAESIAQKAGRHIGVDISARDSAQIGGMIATNAGGMQALRYGTMRAQVMGLEVVTGKGHLLSDMRGLWKNNVGYDWKQLFIASEGTLGIISKAIIRLYPALQQRLSAMLALTSAEAAPPLLRSAQEQFGSDLLQCEIISAAAWQAMCAHESCPPSPMPHPADFVPYYMLLDVAMDDQDRLVNWLSRQSGIKDAVLPQSLTQQQAMWQIRERGASLRHVVGPTAKTDIALRPEIVPEFLKQCHQQLQVYLPGLIPLPFGHLGDGNLHYNVAFPSRAADINIENHRYAIQGIVEDMTVAMGGTFSAEHGIGQTKKSAMARHIDADTLFTLRQIKQLFDPQGICNPGKLLPDATK